MSEHIPDTLLSGFVLGEIDEDLAVEVAVHLDACPMCATRACAAEPLAASFASAPDPEPPAELATAILSELERPQRAPSTEIIVSVALLGAATLLMLAGNPMGAAVQLGVILESLATAAGVVATSVSTSAVAMSLSASTCALFGLIAVRLAAAERRLL